VPEGQRYEAGRVADVLMFGAKECLKRRRPVVQLRHHAARPPAPRVHAARDPLLGVISAITPFNHPMNQVAHKVVPAIATNNRMVLKPSEKVPLSALRLADILYEAGLPPEMLSVVTGDPREIADEMITHPAVDLVTFTGGVAIGKASPARAGYRRMVLELGGNDPIIVMDDADLDEASTLAVQGSYKNSGQRCTAVKRMLVHRSWRRASPTWWSTRRGLDPRRPMRSGQPRWAPSSTNQRHGCSRPASTRRSRRARGCWPAIGATVRCIRPP
jgi:acyl-CoA reductase-like NAD-dependent aldehyde dehydrogenase